LKLPAVPLGRGSFGYWAKRRWPPPFELQHYQATGSSGSWGRKNLWQNGLDMLKPDV
jgi:hypothetical protein